MLKKYFLLLLLSSFFLITSQAQSYWNDFAISRTEEKSIQTKASRGLQLDLIQLAQLLAGAPMENTSGTSGFRFEVPAPGGQSASFFLYEVQMMESSLAQRFPEIKTFRGYSADGKSKLAMSLTPLGLHAMVLSSEGQWFIDPVRIQAGTSLHQSYFRKDFIPNPGKRNQQHCGFTASMNPNNEIKSNPEQLSIGNGNLARVLNGTSRKLYRLAIGATGEYTAFFGGTVNLGLAAIVATVNRVSSVYENELAVRFSLVANNNLLIYTNATTDPFNNNDATILIGQSQTTINSIIGSANYDVGHTFSTGAGGLASLGVICNNSQKARGVTGSPAPVGDPYDIDYVAHELGHQFGANHTFNGDQSSCGGANRNASTAYEPGSGTTIMAYAGICGADDIASNSSPYFHIVSLQEIYNHITTGTGANCPVLTNTGNTPPNLVVTHFDTYTIPPSTPFELVGRGADVNNDAITYCWEQYDLGLAGSPITPSGNMPHFRSFDPTTNPVRSFPKLSDVLGNTSSLGEVMVNYNRTMKFRLTIRDNRANGGGIVFMDSSLTVNVSSTGTAFSVSNLNTATSLQVGSNFNLTWNTGNTSAPIFNTPNVMILLSTDGGLTFPDTLVTSTPNDGSHTLVVPNKVTTSARIKVKGIGNVFYDINNANFSITPAVTNSLSTGNVPLVLCAGSSFSLSYTATGTFNNNNIFTAQLSSVSGSFTTPVNIGTISSTTSGNISVTIPINTVASTGYRIRVVASNPVFVGTDNGMNISISNPTLNPLPFSENFNSVTTGVSPAGWVAEGNQGVSDFTVNGSSVPVVNHGTNNTSGYAANLWANNTSASSVLPLVGPILNSSRFSFDYRVVNWLNYPTTATVLSNNDSLLLEASTDCGFTWISVYLINPSTHTTATAFRTINISLNRPELINKNVQFRFRAVWGAGDYWWDIDNVNIVNVPILLGSLNPASQICVGSSISANFITGATFNNGNVFRLEMSSSTGSFSSPVVIASQTGTSVSNLTGIIPNGTTTSSNYRFRITSTNPVFISDTSSLYTISNRPLSSLPLSENFNAVVQGTIPIGWEADQTSNFDFRVDGNPITPHGINGTRGMAGNLWSGNPTVSLTLPLLGPIYPGSKITYDYRLVNFASYSTNPVATTLGVFDTLSVEVSTDCGLNWTRVSEINATNHQTSLTFANKLGSLDAFAGQNILIRFLGRWVSGDYWWDIDNISVTDGGPIVIDTVLSTSNWCPGQSITANYTLPGTFPSNNVLTLELSDKLGSFANPTVLATANGMGTGALTASLPNGLANGYQYQLRVKASFLNMIGTTYSQSFILHPAFTGTISQTPTATTACTGQTIGFAATSNFNLTPVAGVSYFPHSPSRADSIVIFFSNPSATSAILHWGVNGWTGPDPSYIPAGSSTLQHPAVRTNMTALGGGRFRIAIGPFNNNVQQVSVMDFAINYFQGANSLWDNNNTLDYHIQVANNINPAFIYLWKLNNVTVSQGSSTFSSNLFLNNDSVWVIAKLANVCNNADSIVSNKSKLTINPLLTPTVSINTSSTTFCAGTTVTFNASFTNGGPFPIFQWKVNGNNVGNNSASFTTSALTNNDVVSVVMTANNACQTTATANSNTITVTVNPNLTPAVSISTPNTTICAASNATFTANVTNGGPNPSYQWKLNGNNVGSNSSTYSNSNLNNGSVISCVVTSNNTCQTTNTATSNAVTMTVNPNLVPSVSINASNNTVCAGTNITFTATPINGGTSPSYQWKVNGNNVGSNSTTYTSNALSNGDVVSLVMTANNICQTTSSANSNSVTMVINPNLTPDISIVASKNPGCAGDNITFTATTAQGGSLPAYQWTRNGAVVGSNASSFSSSTLQTGDLIQVILTANNTCQTRAVDSSNIITMSMQQVVTPSVSISTASTTVCQGTNVSFTATPIDGGTTPSYQWKLNGNNVGTNSATYSNSGLNSGDVVSIVMTANNLCQTVASANSNAVTMTVNPNLTPTVSISASANPICAGDNANFSATLNQGGNAPVYQWKVNGLTVGTGTSYATSSLVQGDQIQLVVTANNACQTTATATSNTITLNVNPKLTPSVSISASATTICAGTTISFTATPTNGGSAPNYQWQLNGTPVGSNNPQYSNNSLSNNDQVSLTLTANNTCQTTSIANSNVVLVTVLQASSASITRNICAGQSFNFNGTPLTVGGTYLDTILNAAGCDSLITLTLNVLATSASNLSASICSGSSYNFNGNALTSGGTYRDTLVNSVGCDSVVTLTLQILQPSAFTLNESICAGQSFNFNGTLVSATGTYFDTLTNAVGCDSVITLNLNIKSLSASSLSAQICAGQTYNFNGNLLANTGTYFDTLTNAVGCDSIVTLTLMVNQLSASSLTINLCSGQVYLFNGTPISVSGTYMDTLTNSSGCDSIITLTVNVNQPSASAISASICAGQTYHFNGTPLNSAGTYLDTLVNASGCDSVVSLTLNLLQPTSSSLSANICSGQTYHFNGTPLTSSGVYLDTLVNAAGCDSVVTLTLNQLQPSNSSLSASICTGSTYHFNGTPLTNAGVYLDTLVNAAGCDSIITLTLNVNQPSGSNLSMTICNGAVYNFNGTSISVAGTYTDTLVNSAGCDSVITLTLSITPVLQAAQQASICAGSVYNFNGMMLTAAGTYRDTLQNLAGCDSLVITLTLNVNAITLGNIAASICQGQSYPFNNLQLTNSGTYRDTLVNMNGCDSILTLTLTVNPIPAKPIITRIGNDLSSSATNGNQWYIVGAGAIPGANGQLYTPTQPNGGSFYVISTVSGCSSPSSDTLQFIGTGLNETIFTQWQYFPNPASQSVNIRLELGQADQIRVDITDISGRVVRSVYEGQRSPGQLNLEVPTADLAQGLYLLRLSGSKEQRTGRLLIRH